MHENLLLYCLFRCYCTPNVIELYQKSKLTNGHLIFRPAMDKNDQNPSSLLACTAHTIDIYVSTNSHNDKKKRRSIFLRFIGIMVFQEAYYAPLPVERIVLFFHFGQPLCFKNRWVRIEFTCGLNQLFRFDLL